MCNKCLRLFLQGGNEAKTGNQHVQRLSRKLNGHFYEKRVNILKNCGTSRLPDNFLLADHQEHQKKVNSLLNLVGVILDPCACGLNRRPLDTSRRRYDVFPFFANSTET